MSDFNSLGKEYLKPDYSDEETHFDDPIGGPSEDDDDDDEISDYDEAEEDKEVERLSKDREKLTEKTMTQTPFGTPGGGSNPWGGSNNSTWGTNNSPWGQNNNNNNSPWGGSNNRTWGNGNTGSPWGTPSSSSPTWGGGTGTSGKKEIDRDKDYVFCDVLDCLIETLASNGKPGLLPRGIYDMRLRFEVWDKIACFNPKKVFAMIPRNLILSSNGYNSWEVLLNYVICSLSEYLRVPYGNCQILTQIDFNQGKDLIIGAVIKNEKINPASAIHIGLESGLYGQSNRDVLAARRIGIDYIDLGQLMNLYY